MRSDIWTEAELVILRENYSKMTPLELTKLINRKPNAIKTKAQFMKLKSCYVPKRNWTTEQEETLRKLYKLYTVKGVAARMGKTVGAVRGMVAILQLRKKSANEIVRRIESAQNIKKDLYRKQTPTGGVKFLDLKPNSCRFPFDDGTFCGCNITNGSYCDEHAELCYVKSDAPVKLGRW